MSRFEIDIIIIILFYGTFIGIYLGCVLSEVKGIANSLEDIARALIFNDDKGGDEECQ